MPRPRSPPGRPARSSTAPEGPEARRPLARHDVFGPDMVMGGQRVAQGIVAVRVAISRPRRRRGPWPRSRGARAKFSFAPSRARKGARRASTFQGPVGNRRRQRGRIGAKRKQVMRRSKTHSGHRAKPRSLGFRAFVLNARPRVRPKVQDPALHHAPVLVSSSHIAFSTAKPAASGNPQDPGEIPHGRVLSSRRGCRGFDLVRGDLAPQRDRPRPYRS